MSKVTNIYSINIDIISASIMSICLCLAPKGVGRGISPSEIELNGAIGTPNTEYLLDFFSICWLPFLSTFMFFKDHKVFRPTVRQSVRIFKAKVSF